MAANYLSISRGPEEKEEEGGIIISQIFPRVKLFNDHQCVASQERSTQRQDEERLMQNLSLVWWLSADLGNSSYFIFSY